MTRAPADVVFFGEYAFDLVGLTLSRHGERTALGDQPARVLRFLVERSGRIVWRTELYDAFWPAHCGDAEQSLNNAIRQIRKAIEDDAQAPRYIETIPKRGYRIVAGAFQATPGPSTIFGRKPALGVRAVSGAAAAIGALSIAVASSWPGAGAQALIVMSSVESNCADPNTSRFEKVLEYEILAAASSHPGGARIATQESLRNGAPIRAGHKLEIVADYGVTEGNLYARIIETETGVVVWARKYRVDLAHTRDAIESVGADMQSALRSIG